MLATENKRKRAPDSSREAVKVKAARGEYTLVDPLDYLILGNLHPDGTMFAGLYPLGDTVLGLHKKFSKEHQKALTSSVLSSRLRVLALQDLVLHKYAGVTGGGKQVWQRTKEGNKVLAAWKAKQSQPKAEGGE